MKEREYGLATLEGADGPLRELALFAGAGGGILGGLLLGWRTVCAVECDAYAASVLVRRQNDRLLAPFPVWDDVRTFAGGPWRDCVDVVSGGFPCVDISCAGKGAGIDGERSGLWREMARIVSEVRPKFVFVENSPLLVQRGLAVVLTDLAKLGYDARWGIVSAENAGYPHLRKRMWICAHAGSDRLEGRKIASHVGRVRTVGKKQLPRLLPSQIWMDKATSRGNGAIDGIPCIVDRLKAIGNGQVPAVARLAWLILTGQVEIE